MAETTESNEARSRRPLKIAAPLLGFLGAVVGSVLGATVLHAVFRDNEPGSAYVVGISVGGLYVLL